MTANLLSFVIVCENYYFTCKASLGSIQSLCQASIIIVRPVLELGRFRPATLLPSELQDHEQIDSDIINRAA